MGAMQHLFFKYGCLEPICTNSIIDERSDPMSAIKLSAQASRFPGIRFLNSFGRALNARDAFNELSLLNDSELSKRGLDRNSLFKHVVEKLG